MPPFSPQTDFAVEIAKQAGKILTENYHLQQKIEYKLKTNYKIEVDDIIDNFLREQIKQKYPSHNIYSEENSVYDKASEYSWVFDPLDGTLNYALKLENFFSISIALVKNKIPILGVLYSPLRDELYVAEQNKGAFCNGRPISVSGETNINHAVVCMDYGKIERTKILEFQKKLLGKDGVNYTLTLGSATMQLAFVALSKVEAYTALNLEPWDMAAAALLVKEAGGIVTNIQGQDWQIDHESILAANPGIHSQLFALYKS